MHPAQYSDLNNQSENSIRQSLNKAQSRFREMLDFTPNFFAYPFGAYHPSYQNIISDYNFDLALGQNSSVAYNQQSHKYKLNSVLPRFTMTEEYGNVERFFMTIDALPLPATEITPGTTALNSSIGFTLPNELTDNAEKISCFASDHPKPDVSIISQSRIELRLHNSNTPDRMRINCTMPVENETEDTPRWRWLGMLFTQ